MSTELGIRDVAFEVDDLQAAIDRVAADGNGRKTRLVMRVLPRLPSDCRFSLGGRPEWPNPHRYTHRSEQGLRRHADQGCAVSLVR